MGAQFKNSFLLSLGGAPGWLMFFAVVSTSVFGCKGKKKPAEPKPDVVVPHAAETPIGPVSVTSPPVLPNAPFLSPPPLGIPAPPSPKYNPVTKEKVALGRLLFFDPRLSGNNQISCGSCHQPSRTWSDGKKRSTTEADVPNLRHTPVLANVAFHPQFYWDGRGDVLEETLFSHWRGQMTEKPSQEIRKIEEMPRYRAHFRRAFDTGPSVEGARDALASYVRTLLLGDSPWDKYEAGDKSSVSEEVALGFKVFTEIAGCGTCHTPPLYTDMKFHRRLSTKESHPDTGRYRTTQNPLDMAAFKTPTLRGAVSSAPYFHNGSAPTLEDAIDRELKASEGRDPLSDTEMAALVAFVRSLSGPTPQLPLLELPSADNAGNRRDAPPNINLGVGFPSILDETKK